MLVRSTRSPDAVARDVVDAFRWAGLIGRVSRVTTMREALAESIRARRLNAWLFGVFAAASLAIVAVGILGLIAMATARRTREIGVRYALGGTRGGIVGLVVREQVMPIAAGLLAGGAVAAWAGQFIGAYLYRFQPSDPRLWTTAVLTVIAAALAGTLIPAWRASRVDPVHALRAE
jgi:ABC-type antimicrobial peptide transport system permease subunit